MVALAADGTVGFGATNEFNLSGSNGPLCECSVGAAIHAHSRQLVDLLSHWDELQNTPKWLASKVAIQSRNDDNFASIGSRLTELNHIREELALIDGNHIVEGNALPRDVSEAGTGDSG